MKKLIYTFIAVLISQSVCSQIIDGFSRVSPEKIYVHKNASVLLTGEYLYFSIFCINTENNEFSTFSKVAYIDLVDQSKQVVLHQKVLLSQGTGQGDFFIPTSLKSGSYKLIVYTKWMQNNRSEKFNQSNLIIINPYLAVQPNASNVINKKNNKIRLNNTTSYGVKVATDKNVYKKREKVSLNIQPITKSNKLSRISISVRRIDSLDLLVNDTTSSYNFINKTNNKESLVNPLKFYPENKGAILEGKLIKKESNEGSGFKDIAISVPGNVDFFKMVKTNFNGDFRIDFNSYFDGNLALLQLVSDKKDKKDSIVLTKDYRPSYKNLTFEKFSITPNLKQELINRSIYNQIESNYFTVKPDSIITPIPQKPFYYKEKAIIIKLDDYRRFATLKETFLEVVDPVYVKRINGEITFNIRRPEDYLYENLKPLVLLDGVLIQDYNWLLNFNAYRVDNIRIIKKNIVLGPKNFKGIIAIETTKKDVDFAKELPDIIPYKIEKPLLPKKYFQQNYDTASKKLERIPDYRIQLLWKPRMYLSKSAVTLPFYTSDSEGTYKVVVEGFTNTGKPISATTYFKVE